jgi:ADP-ribose pyrophosphatase
MSGEIKREVFERGQAAAVLPYDPVRDEVVLIRQFRAGSYVAGRHPWGWEAVAGIIEDGETPADVARREAVEEAAITITDLLPMGTVVLSPGACSETCTSFLGRADTKGAGGIFGLESENENILVKAVPTATRSTTLSSSWPCSGWRSIATTCETAGADPAAIGLRGPLLPVYGPRGSARRVTRASRS